MLDNEKSNWYCSPRDGTKVSIDDFAFHRNRLGESSIFKIPETVRAGIYTFTGLKDPEDEFKTAYEAAGLKGLLFEEIWSDES
ncbi:MAG: hypothetical protein ACSHX0_13485 [Akkermansiaceae bacterium]